MVFRGDDAQKRYDFNEPLKRNKTFASTKKLQLYFNLKNFFIFFAPKQNTIAH